MNDDDLKFLIGCDDMGKRPTVYPKIGMGAAIVRLVRMVREQDKRARHAEAERDAFNARINELEAEQAKSWDEFEKETLTALGSDVIGTIVDAGSDIPGMIRRLHERYHAEIRQEQLRRTEAEEQRDTYKRIANMKQRKDKP